MVYAPAIMTTNPIAEQLELTRREAADLRSQIERLSRQYEITRARLDAFEFAAKAFDDATPKASAKLTRAVAKSRVRLPSTEWQSVFQALHLLYDKAFGYDEICDTAAHVGVDVKRPSLRTKMMNYVNDGHVERVGDGKFRLTSKGFGHFKIGAPPPEAIEPLNGSAASGSIGREYQSLPFSQPAPQAQ